MVKSASYDGPVAEKFPALGTTPASLNSFSFLIHVHCFMVLSEHQKCFVTASECSI